MLMHRSSIDLLLTLARRHLTGFGFRVGMFPLILTVLNRENIGGGGWLLRSGRIRGNLPRFAWRFVVPINHS